MRRIKSEIKRGQLSKADKREIERLCETKSDAEIAKLLKRPEKTVQQYKLSYLTNNPGLASKKADAVVVREELHQHHQWQYIQQQYTQEELILFEGSYVELVSQFKGDILPTERKQIFQAINIEILLFRHNKERIEIQKEIDRMKRILDDIYSEHGEQIPDNLRDTVLRLESDINSMRAMTQNKTREFKDLSDRQSDLTKELKGTREQRIKRIEDSKQSFTGLLRQLEEEEFRNRAGVDMAIMDEAVKVETERLSQYHEYMDGEVDQPFLTPDTIK